MKEAPELTLEQQLRVENSVLALMRPVNSGYSIADFHNQLIKVERLTIQCNRERCKE
jgi:hypothetical protein